MADEPQKTTPSHGQTPVSPEAARMSDPKQAARWRAWGPYLSERAWGTVREDYSPDGSAWTYFTHDMARSRAYRWNEDGIGGICDEQQILCFAPAFWNGHDPILKERMFGLTNQEGNHGEDVKELWFYLDNTPSHSYMKMVYRYPHAEFPYRQLVEINRHRGLDQPEYEIADTGVFADNAFFDITLEYAKREPGVILFRCSAKNCGKNPAVLHVLPTLWFRNTWSWGAVPGKEPVIRWHHTNNPRQSALHAQRLDNRSLYLYALEPLETLFTFNETNRKKLWGASNTHPAVKDAFHDFLVGGQHDALHAEPWGTKVSPHYQLRLAPGATQQIMIVLSETPLDNAFDQFEELFTRRIAEADAFYADMLPQSCDPRVRPVQRQAMAGLLWSKQFYNYDVNTWLHGDSGDKPPAQRLSGRNRHWPHFKAHDVIIMPDKWEYPWFAGWDWAFHCLTMAYVDIELAKQQLELVCSERFQNLSGELPAYEWSFDDVNPPVQALAAWRVYNSDKRRRNGQGDLAFLERMYHKLLLNFVWWVNRKDSHGRNVFEGGFLGLDNISVFDRSRPLPVGQALEQADATGWMGLFCLNMMTIGMELSQHDPVYSHLALKFLDHFVAISSAINSADNSATSLWDPDDGFYYDTITSSAMAAPIPVRLRSQVGLIPLLAVQILEKSWFDKLPAFRDRWDSEVINRAIGNDSISCTWSADKSHCLLGIASKERLERALLRVVDENEFLSPFGLRSLSRYHRDNPYILSFDHQQWEVRYEPAESRSGVFGGNSNWRGPIWFPTAYLLITALRTYHRFYGDSLTLPWPGRPNDRINLLQLSEEIARRMISIFLPDADGRRPVFGDQALFRNNPLWNDMVLFHEYFNGDNGAGLGASHQTGWTALVVQLVDYVTRNYTHTGG